LETAKGLFGIFTLLNDMNKKKLLILDGLSELALAKDFYQGCLQAHINAEYCDLASLPKKRFYFLFKFINKLKSLFSGSRANNFAKQCKIDPHAIEKAIVASSPTHILVFRYAYKFINPELLKKYASALNCKIYLYDTDSCNLFPDQNEFIYFIEKELVIYDEILSFSKVATDFFVNTRNLPATYFPYGSNPILKENTLSETIDVLFVGRSSFRRIFLLEYIKDKVSIYGNRWNKSYPVISPDLKSKIVNRTVWGDDLTDLMFQSKIVLNITNSNFYCVETGLNLRIFEVLAAGGFLLTDHYGEISELLEIGKEIETYSSGKELKEKVEYYLSHDEERKKIAAAGKKKFYELYTWEQRVKSFASKVGM
jgi:spore maturation protein CgeB